MARVVVIADSDSGELVDVAGNKREDGRYRKLAKRMMSSDKDPVIDYGANGGSKLTISSNGGAGDEIVLDARKVTISGDMTVGEKTIAAVAQENAGKVLDNLCGKSGEITIEQNLGSGIRTIAISGSFKKTVNDLGNAVSAGLVYKAALKNAISGLWVKNNYSASDVRNTLKQLLNSLHSLVGDAIEQDTTSETSGTSST